MGVVKHNGNPGSNLLTDGNFTTDPAGVWDFGSGWAWDSVAGNMGFSGGATEMVTNGDFTGAATGWTVGTDWSYSSNHLVHTAPGSGGSPNGIVSQNIGAVAGEWYAVTLTVTGTISGVLASLNAITIQIGDVSSPESWVTTTGTITVVAKATGANLLIYGYPNFNGTIDNVSVKHMTLSQDIDAAVGLARVTLDVGGTVGGIDVFLGNPNASAADAAAGGHHYAAAAGTVTFDQRLYGENSFVVVPSTDFDGTIDNAKVQQLFIQALTQDVTSTGAGDYALRMKIGGTAGTITFSMGEEFEQEFSAGAGTIFTQWTGGTFGGGIFLTPSEDFDGSLDNVSVRKIISPGHYGPELVTNGRFDGGASGWQVSQTEDLPFAGWTYSGEANAGTLPTYNPSLLSAVTRVEQGLSTPRFVVGGQGGDEAGTYALFKKGTAYTFNLFRGPVFHVGTPFTVEEVCIPLAQDIGPDMSVIPVLRFDNEQNSAQGTVIDDSNFNEAREAKFLNYMELKSDNFEGNVKGTNNFYLELQFTGAALCTVSLPITITIHIEKTGKRETFVIGSIFDGMMPSGMFGAQGQYLAGIGIDPDIPISDNAEDVRTGGLIRPVVYVPFSGEAVDAAPIAIIPNPINNLTYVVLSNGKLLSYDENLDAGGETLVASDTAGAARGGFYYNNFIYVTVPDDVSRYGPLDGTPSYDENVWTGSELGTQDALEDVNYPESLFGLGYLNHFGIVHIDGAAYFLDYLNGIGLVHKIHTTEGSAQGDTDDPDIPSAYGILDLPPNWIPITISSYGNDMVVSASFTTDPTILQGKAALFFFNPADTTPSFYRQVALPDAICPVLKYDNGILYGLSGDLAGGYRLFQYVGGDSIQTLKMIEDGVPPLQSASDFTGNRLVWGGNTTWPINSSGLFAYGSKSDLFPRGLHHIAVTGFQ